MTSKDLGELLGAIPRRVVIVDDEKVVLRALERAFFDAGVKTLRRTRKVWALMWPLDA